MRRIRMFVLLASLPGAALAQQATHRQAPLDGQVTVPVKSRMIHDHNDGMNHDGAQTEETVDVPHEAGQSAFAALQEIVMLLEAERKTDWSRVDIEGLRQHLIDMDNVTVGTEVSSREISGGIRFEATSGTPAVAASIARMTLAHVMTMDGVNGWRLEAAETPGGAALTVTPAQASDLEKIRGLGFIGVMTVGMHHQEHHLAIATGRSPH